MLVELSIFLWGWLFGRRTLLFSTFLIFWFRIIWASAAKPVGLDTGRHPCSPACPLLVIVNEDLRRFFSFFYGDYHLLWRQLVLQMFAPVGKHLLVFKWAESCNTGHLFFNFEKPLTLANRWIVLIDFLKSINLCQLQSLLLSLLLQFIFVLLLLAK